MTALAQIVTRSAATLTLLFTFGCSASSAATDMVEDASAETVEDVTVEDAPVATVEDAPECYSPLQPNVQPGIPGCECETYDAGPQGLGRLYCLDGQAVYCPLEQGRWVIGFDGPCFPKQMPVPLNVCTEHLGGGLVARGAGCPSGFALEVGFENATDCCYPIRVSAQECTNAGFEVQVGEADDDVLQTTCDQGRAPRAFVGESGTTVCCEPQ